VKGAQAGPQQNAVDSIKSSSFDGVLALPLERLKALLALLELERVSIDQADPRATVRIAGADEENFIAALAPIATPKERTTEDELAIV
jgi:hypothetical protein